MEPFATVADYRARFGQAADEQALTECLKGCSAVIRDEMERAGLDWENPSGDLAARMLDVCRSMANRIAPDSLSVPAGVTQASVGAGGFTQSYSFAGYYGIARMLPSERRLLGIPSARIGLARMGGGDG